MKYIILLFFFKYLIKFNQDIPLNHVGEKKTCKNVKISLNALLFEFYYLRIAKYVFQEIFTYVVYKIFDKWCELFNKINK